jgi:hypothetical protein
MTKSGAKLMELWLVLLKGITSHVPKGRTATHEKQSSFVQYCRSSRMTGKPQTE